MNENERHLMPRGVAFRQPPRRPPEDCSGLDAEALATRELAQHGDPSVKNGATGQSAADGRAAERRLKLRWERFPDLAAAAATATIRTSAELNMTLHTLLREQAHRGTTAMRRGGRKLAAPHAFGRTAPAHDPAGRDIPAM